MVGVAASALSARRAYELFSETGSYVSAGDPGAPFYSFHVNDGRPVNENHRQACLRYLDETVIPRATAAHDRHREDQGSGRVADSQVHATGERLKDLASLRRFLIATPLRSPRTSKI